MAAATEFSTQYYKGLTDGDTIAGHPRWSQEVGFGITSFEATVPTTSIDDVSDIYVFCPVPDDCAVVCLISDAAALGTGLVANLIFIDPDDDTETTWISAYNPAAAISDGVKKTNLALAQKADSSSRKYYNLAMKTTTAPGTPAAGSVSGLVFWVRNP